MTREINDLWWLGLVVGILEILLAFWASQQFFAPRAALILLWVGFFGDVPRVHRDLPRVRGPPGEQGAVDRASTGTEPSEGERSRRRDVSAGRGNGGVVNEEGNGPKEQSPEEIEAELERVKAERQELEARVETLEAKPEKRRRLRRIFTPILVALSIVVFTVTVPAAWGARTVLNTDRYVATVAPLADDPAVQASIATKLTDQVFAALDVEGTLVRCPRGPRGARDGARGSAHHRGQGVRAGSGPQGRAERRLQDVLGGGEPIRAYAGAGDPRRRVGTSPSVVEGKVLLNLLPLVNLALGSIQAVASDLVGRDVTLPQI